MRRCAKCEFENGADATACARCGQPLGRDGGVATAVRGEMPAWLSSLQPGAASGEGGEKAGAAAGGAVAAAAALPIQVRRSRVPVLSVDAGRATAAGMHAGASGASDAIAPPSPTPTAAGEGAASLSVAAPPSRARQRLLLILLIIVAIITIVVLRHAMP